MALASAPLKRFYKYLLKRVIGSFLKRDIDLDQLEVQLWSGQVQLKGLELDVSSLNALGLSCTAANLGCVKMVVPWRRLVSDHCKVYISGLHLVFAQADHWKAPSPDERSPPGFFADAPRTEESRYSEEGIETLSRLVKRVLGRMEVCVEDASATAKLKPCLLRVKLSSALLFSEPGPSDVSDSREETVKTRSLRVGTVSLSMAPSTPSDPSGREVVFFSTRGQESTSAAAGALMLQRDTRRGVAFAALRLPAIRVALTPSSCHLLAEALTWLSQALRKPAPPMPDIEDLHNSVESPTELDAEEAAPPMVQSLFQSAMAHSPGHFWQDLYSLFQADDQLASAAGDEQEAVEGESAEPDQQEEEAFLDVLEGEDLKAPTVRISLKVSVGHLATVLCLSESLVEEFWDRAASHPQPLKVNVIPWPMLRPESQAQLCIGGFCLNFEKEIADPQAPTWDFSAERIAVHLHRYHEVEPVEEAGLRGASEQVPAELGRSALVTSELFRSAVSRLDGQRTPSIASEKCPTDEAISLESESESFGNSSVCSFDQDSPVASRREAEEEGDPGAADEELHDAFFGASLSQLLPKAPADGARTQRSRSHWQHWHHSAPHFLTKQVLDFDGGSSSSSTCRPWPSSPAPGSEHPIWSTLGFQPGVPRQLWVRAEAEGRDARRLRISCLPVQMSLCSKSVQLLGVLSRSRACTGTEEPAELATPEASNVELTKLPTFVAIAPAIRLILRLPDGASLIGDLVLPRLFVPSSCEEETHSEALRFDMASGALYLANAQDVKELLSLRPPGAPPGVVHRHALELSLLTRQAPSSPSTSPPSPPQEAEPSDSPQLSGWTRLTALRPAAPGHLHSALPASQEPGQEEERKVSEDDTEETSEGVSPRSPVEVEMSVLGDVQVQVGLSTLCHLKHQALSILAELQQLQERPSPPSSDSSQRRWGFAGTVQGISVRVTEDLADQENGGSSTRISAVQLSLINCHLRGAALWAQDLRGECIEKDSSGRSIVHTLVRPWFSPSLCQRQRGSSEAVGPQGPQGLGDVTLSGYLWQTNVPRRRIIAPPEGTFAGGSLQLKAQTLQLTRLVVLLERSLLQELHWLQHLATEENERPPTETSTMTGASSSSRSFRLQLVDCLIDVPSDALSRQWPCSSPNGLAVPTPPPKERTLDTEQWRLVLSLARVDLRIRSQAQKTAQRSLLLRCGRIQGYLSDHPANLSQLELWSESTGEFLSSMGFAPILEISSASCSAGKETAKEAELQLGHVQCHLRADSARALRHLVEELSALLPVAPQVSMPDVVTQQAMPSDFDFGEEAFPATGDRLDETENNILAGVDMFAFAPTARAPDAETRIADPGAWSNALDDALNSSLGGSTPGPLPTPELIRASSAASASSSCRVDEYIRAQEQQQSPRSPVTACATHEEEGSYEMELLELPQAIDEELDEDEVPAASSPEASEAVAVCLFDPEVVSEQRLQELCDEEATARQQVEQQFRHELQELQELQDRRGGARAEEAEVEAETKVRYQDGSSVLVFDMGAEITEDYFVRGELGNRKFEAPRWAPPALVVLRLRVEEFSLSVYQGADFRFQATSEVDQESIATDRQSRSHVTVHLRSLVAKYMQFPAELPRGVGARKLVEASTLRMRLVLCVLDFDIRDRVHGSVFSRLLACFEDDEKRPRPSEAEMLHLRVDELVHGARNDATPPAEPEEVAPEYNVELQLLPLQLTVDQDTVEFLEDFWQLSSMSTYVEEDGAQDYLAAAGIRDEATAAEASSPDPADGDPTAQPLPVVPLFFQQVTVGSLLVSVDYKAKRLDVEALRRGELWQLVNLLPLLEGLQVHFRSVTVKNARGYEKVLAQVVQGWSADLNRTQLLRSLTGVTPIRSIANIGGGFAEMVLEPLKQYRAGEDAEQVSRTMLRGLISFLRHMTIESIDLTERVFLGAQAALEYANTCLAEELSPPQRASGSATAPAVSAAGGSAAPGASASASGSDWLPVERGAAEFLQPGGAKEGLQEAGSNLTRGLRNAGPFLVRPLLEIQRGAPKKQVLRSVVSGIPMCVLRPAIGVTSAAVPAIRGVRNRLDPSHRREMVRKYRGPG